MAGLSIHIVVYAVVNAVLVGAWIVQGGTTEELRAVVDDPLQGIRDGFWPGWVIAGWAPALALHLGIWLSLAVFGRRARRRRLKLARMAMSVHHRRHERRPAPAASAAPATPPGRKWVAAMFTDIAGSTSLAETLGDDAWREMLADHRRLVRECVLECGGTEVGTQGDGFLVRFDSPSTAVACATAIHRRIADARRSGVFAPRLRIAVHAGEAVHDDGDLVGRVVNLAARVLAVAGPDEILVTEPVADHVPPSVRLADRGLQPLRGITQPRHLLAVLWEDEPVDERRTAVSGDAETDRA